MARSKNIISDESGSALVLSFFYFIILIMGFALSYETFRLTASYQRINIDSRSASYAGAVGQLMNATRVSNTPPSPAINFQDVFNASPSTTHSSYYGLSNTIITPNILPTAGTQWESKFTADYALGMFRNLRCWEQFFTPNQAQPSSCQVTSINEKTGFKVSTNPNLINSGVLPVIIEK